MGKNLLASLPKTRYNQRMQDEQEQQEAEKIIDWAQARELAEQLDVESYDEAVVNFLTELLSATPDYHLLEQAATMLLQDELDLSPELEEYGVEPDDDLIELFILSGADLNARNAYGETPLGLAARYGYEDIATYLLQAGARKEQANAEGKLPVDLASTPALIDMLMPEKRKGADELISGAGDDFILPDHIEDADIEAPDEAEEARFSPQFDCGLGDEKPVRPSRTI